MKKMDHIFRPGSAILSLFLLVLSACEQDNDPFISQQEELEIANQSSAASNIMDEDMQLFDEVLKDTEIGSGRMEKACPEVSKDENPNRVVLDFGDGCTGSYGRVRSGKVIIEYAGITAHPNADRVITFDNYYINDHQVTGKIEVVNFERNEIGNLTLERRAIDYAVHFAEGIFFTINGSTKLEWLEGEGDGDRSNNVWQMTGDYSGISSRGRNVSFKISQPVVIKFSCREEGRFLRVKGITKLSVEMSERKRVRTINYGNGDCDDTILVTIHGEPFHVALG